MKSITNLLKGRRVTFLVISFFLILNLVFFYKMFRGLSPIPMDAMVGSYYPWLDYGYGGYFRVPVKNPAVSDVYAQYYPWQNLAHELLQKGQIPLWNPFSFSGTPLVGNWQSNAFYPLNLMFLPFSGLTRWDGTVFLQPLLSLFFFYLFLRELKTGKLASIFGSIVYSFSGFMLIFLEYNSFAQTAVWTPLILFILERFINKRYIPVLLFLPFAVFTLVTGGNFQVVTYTMIMFASYAIFRTFALYKNRKTRLKIILLSGIFFGIGIGMASLQLFPTLELFQNSIRKDDPNIVDYNYGLLPVQSIITFFAPDYFGSPVTGNFWGHLYHETMGYFGIVTLPFVIFALFKRRDFTTKFFGLFFVVSVILIFDTFVGKVLYLVKLPLLSTSYASRMLFLVDFSAGILAAKGLEEIAASQSRKNFLKIIAILFLILLFSSFGLYLMVKYIGPLAHFKYEELLGNLKFSLRNSILPLALLAVLALALRIKKSHLFMGVIIFLTIADLFRFGWKYTAFSSADMLYPDTPLTTFLKQNVGYHRVEREKGEIMPPNTWMPYGLMSPSGYDPLYSKQYAVFHNVYKTQSVDAGLHRYAELDNLDSEFLDLVGVKYLIVGQRDKNNIIDQYASGISYTIKDKKYKQVFKDKSLVVLENTHVMPRVVLFDKFDVVDRYKVALTALRNNYPFRDSIILDNYPVLGNYKKDPTDKAKILDYQANEVTIKTSVSNNNLLMLTDAYYPGWEVLVNGKSSKLLMADGVFRAVEVPKGESVVKFFYNPKSFKYGAGLSLISLGISGACILFFILKKNYRRFD